MNEKKPSSGIVTLLFIFAALGFVWSLEATIEVLRKVFGL